MLIYKCAGSACFAFQTLKFTTILVLKQFWQLVDRTAPTPVKSTCVLFCLLCQETYLKNTKSSLIASINTMFLYEFTFKSKGALSYCIPINIPSASVRSANLTRIRVSIWARGCFKAMVVPVSVYLRINPELPIYRECLIFIRFI